MLIPLHFTTVMSRQLSLGSFLAIKSHGQSAAARPRNLVAGKKQCPYCHDWFFPQGFAIHVKNHQANNEVPRKKARYGKVKLRGEANPDEREVVIESDPESEPEIDPEIEELLSDSDNDNVEVVSPGESVTDL